MAHFFSEHKEILGWLALLSAIIFLTSLALAPWIVVRIPVDYFASRHRPPSNWSQRHPLQRWAIWGVRNLLGIVLILAGLAMLILPGQGVLTIVAGILLMDFPGKYRFERRVIGTRPVLRTLNWLRKKNGAEPLQVD